MSRKMNSKESGILDKEVSDDQFVFEDQIDFIKESVMDGDNFDHAHPLENQEPRKKLPIFPWRYELLEAVHDHQILVILGEAGSGKTTQIPQYLHEIGYTKRGVIACTQPERVAVISAAVQVSEEMGVQLGGMVGYSSCFESCMSVKTILKYMTDEMLVREFLADPMLERYRVVMLDEAHERTHSIDILLGLVKVLAGIRPALKVLISCATSLDAEKFSNYFDFAPIFKIRGRRYPVEMHFAKAPVANSLDAAMVTSLQIHVTQPPGDILVFLTDQEEIESAEEILKHRTGGLGTQIGELIICSLYADLQTELLSKIFEPTPEGARKVVLATNIAETSLTIDGIKYVIDPGFCKIKEYLPSTGMESSEVVSISKASAMQRAGCSGRTGLGKCFRLYNGCDGLNDFIAPEFQRIDLASGVLCVKAIGINDFVNMKYMDAPPSENLIKSLELLYALEALNRRGELTKLGKCLSNFPLHPMLSKMIMASEKYMCSEEIISIAAMLLVGNSIFYCPKGKQVEADNAKLKFYTGNVGDHIALLRIYNKWRGAYFSAQWCRENYIQLRSMERARGIRYVLASILEQLGIQLISNANDKDDAIKKTIISGFFPHCARLQKDGSYLTLKHSVKVNIHPTSGLAHFLPRWVVFHEVDQQFIRHVTQIDSDWLVDIAHHYYPSLT